MTASASVEVDFIAQTAAFNANITKAAQNLNSNAAKMNASLQLVQNKLQSFSTAAKGLVFGAIAKEIAGVALRGLDYAASLAEQAQQLGVTSKDLQTYRYAASQVGISQEEMEKGLQKLTRSLGDASVGAAAPKAAFKALGISVRDAQGSVKTAGQVIPEIAKAFDKVTSPAQRAAAEVALFGKTGQQLDTLLGGGSAQVRALTQAAQDLGLVLSEDQIANADKTADKISELKMVLEANIAGAMANNTQAIYNFVDSLVHLVAAIPETITWLRKLNDDFNIAFYTSRQALPYLTPEARAEAQTQVNNARGDKAIATIQEQWRKASDAQRKAMAPFIPENVRGALGLGVPNPTAKRLPGTNLANFKASPSPKGGVDKAARDLEDYQQQQAALNTQLLQATRANLFSVNAQYANDKKIADSEGDQLEATLRKKAVTNKVVAAHLGELLGVAAQVQAQKEITLKNQMLDEQSKNAVELLTAANDNASNLLQAQEQTARTADERRAIELQLLDLDTINQRLKLQQIKDSTTASEQEKKLAQQGLDALGDLVDARRDAVMKATEGPLGQYINGLPQRRGDVIERQQQVIVDAANRLIERTQQFADSFASSINSGVQDLLEGKSVMESLKDVVSGLAQTFQKAFILDPLEDFVRNKISGPFSEKLFHTNAGPNGLSQAENNQALAAAGNISKLTNFGTAVDAAARTLQRLQTAGVQMEPFGGDFTGLNAPDASANYDGVIMENPFASASDGLSGLGASADSVTKSLNAQVPALAQFGSGLLSILGGNVSGGGGGFLQGLLGIAGMFAGGMKGGGGIGGGTNYGGVIMESFDAFAGGGRPRMGVPSWVGERGRELFVPDMPGSIIPHGASMRLSRMAANNNDRGGTYHINVSGPMNDRDARRTGAQIATAMRQEQARTAKAGF